MTKTKYYILIFILSLICTNKVCAVCTPEEMNEFKKIEDKYRVTYEFDMDSKTYSLFFKSPKPDNYHYVIYTESDLNCTTENESTLKCINFKPDMYTIEIVGMTDTCDDILKTFDLNLTRYNNYASDPLCEGIEEFVLCNPLYDKEIDYETFVSRVNTYKKTKDKEIIENEHTTDDTEPVDNVINYIKDNIIQIFIIIIFVVLLIITIVITAQSIRKSRRLE